MAKERIRRKGAMENVCFLWEGARVDGKKMEKIVTPHKSLKSGKRGKKKTTLKRGGVRPNSIRKKEGG